MNTTHALSAASLRVANCKFSEDERRFVDQLATAIAAAEKSLVNDPRKLEYQRNARIEAGRTLADLLHSIVLHRLDRWLTTPEGRAAVESVTGPKRSKDVLVRYLKDRQRVRDKQDPKAIPSLLDIAHWIFTDSQLQPANVARELTEALGNGERDFGILNLFLAGQFRNVLSHRADYEKVESPAPVEPDLAAWVFRSASHIDVYPGALQAMYSLMLRLFGSNELLEPLHASSTAVPVERAPVPEPAPVTQPPAFPPAAPAASPSPQHLFSAPPSLNSPLSTHLQFVHTAPSPSATTPVRANRSLAAPVALVVLLLGGSMAATVALSNDTRLHSEHRAAERPTTLSAPHAYNSPAGSSAVESPESVLARWDDSVQHPVGHAFEDMYTPFASIHGSRQTPDRNVAEALRGTWRGRIADGGWFRSQRRVRNEDLPSRRPSEAARVCVDPENPNARVVRFLAHAEWRDPSASRNRNVPCEELRGTFVWRLVETTAGWRICQESWDIADAICLSCPQASVCAQR